MTKEEILKRVKKFQGANREFSQELPPVIEGLVDLIDEAGPEVVNNLTSNSPTKALSANMGKELKLMVDGKVSEPKTAGTAGQILQLDEEGVPEWVDAAEVGATYDSTVSDTSTNAIQNKTIKKYVDDNFAQKDGYYGSLTAGAAENLVGRGSVPAEIAFRTSGGDQDLGTGSALITKILGRTVAWNQLANNSLFPDVTRNGVAWSHDLSGMIMANGTSSGYETIGGWLGLSAGDIPAGHKVYIKIALLGGSVSGTFAVDYVNPGDACLSTLQNAYIRTVASGSRSYVIYDTGTVFTNAKIFFSFIDLTLMYGAGNEPSTVAEFEAFHPLGNYNYNAGVLKNNAATGLETTGFNQWDEEWEVGGYIIGTGTPYGYTDRIRSKNAIPVFPSTQYYFSDSNTHAIFFYDAGGNYISDTGSVGTNIFTTPANCAFIKFNLFPTYGTTYNHDICINLSWSGYRNGEYEPYEKHTLALPLNAIACHDEQDNAVVVNGLDGVGTSQDELIVENGWGTKINKKRTRINLGDLNWTKSTSGVYDFFFSGVVSEMKQTTSGAANLICQKYTTSDAAASVLFSKDKQIGKNSGRLYIYDTALSGGDAAAFKAAMAGVYADVELATPKVLTLDNPIPASYYVNDFGTEARLPQDTADNPQAPFCAEIQYAMNATDTIRRLPSQYISDESMTNILTALKTAGIIADFTLTYDSEHQYFTCSVTAPTTEGE